jgi:hypothetical protein
LLRFNWDIETPRGTFLTAFNQEPLDWLMKRGKQSGNLVSPNWEASIFSFKENVA